MNVVHNLRSSRVDLAVRQANPPRASQSINSPTGERLRTGPAGREVARRVRERTTDRSASIESDGHDPEADFPGHTQNLLVPPEAEPVGREVQEHSVALADAREFGSSQRVAPVSRHRLVPMGVGRVSPPSRWGQHRLSKFAATAHRSAAVAGVTPGNRVPPPSTPRPSVAGRERGRRASGGAPRSPNTGAATGRGGRPPPAGQSPGSTGQGPGPRRPRRRVVVGVQVVGGQRDVVGDEHPRADRQARALPALVVAVERARRPAPPPRSPSASASPGRSWSRSGGRRR